MKKTLVIGSQGYLGSVITSFLAKENIECTGIDTGFFADGKILEPDYVYTIKKDAREICIKDIEDFDAVIMLAGISNDPFGHMTSEQIYDPTRDYAIAIAKMCKDSGTQYIYPSSCSVRCILN